MAVKVLQEKFSERFEREARAIAAMNHSNICTLHDVGTNYLVMEYIEGFPVTPEANPRVLLDIAVQIGAYTSTTSALYGVCELPSALVRGIRGVRKSDPVEGISKNRVHRFLFGVP